MALSAAILSSCMEEAIPENGAGTSTQQGDTVSLTFRTGLTTRSSASPDEDALQSLTVMAYRDGMLERYGTSSGGREVTLPLYISEQYDLYAVANIDLEPPVDQRDLEKCRYTITSIGDLDGPMAMAWSRKGVTIDTGASEMQMDLERLASRISFSVDASLLSGLEVKSVRLRQCALEMEIFPPSGFSRVTGAAQAGDCDMASSQDISDVNSGKAVCFYTLENCQGSLLPENRDPWDKSPDALGEKAGLCTYIEVECSFAPGHVLEGDVTYRFYPGEDNTSNFDIRRNRNLHVTLCPTGDGLKGISWKVEADVAVSDGSATGYIDEGRHGLDNLYIGERFYYAVELDRELCDYLGGDLTRCSLRFESQDSGDIKFDTPDHEPEFTIMFAHGTCTSNGSGCIWLYGPDGGKVCRVSGTATIRKPALVLSDKPSVGTYDKVPSLEEEPLCTINGKPYNLHVYLVDSDGYNLNTADWSGFDLGQFSFDKSPYWDSGFDIGDSFSIAATDGVSSSGGPAVTYSLMTQNDGSDHGINSELAKAVRQSGTVRFDIDETRHSISGSGSAALDFHPITLTLVDNGWAGYHASQISLKVNNRSNMPLDLDVWQVNTSNDKWNAVDRNKIIQTVEQNYLVYRPQYITNSYYDNDAVLYGSDISIRSERNGNGADYLEDGYDMVYPLSDISTTVISNTQLYDMHGQTSLSHLIDVRMDGSRLYSSEVSAADSLSDGSMKYDIIYGDDPEYGGGWNDRGIWLYSTGLTLREPETSLDRYNNLSAARLTSLMDRVRRSGAMNMTLTYDSASGQLYVSCPKGNLFGIKIDASITVTAEGYVQTHPNGTWFGAKDNYCSSSSSRTVSGITVGSGRTSIDGGAVRECMDKIYNTTFFDSHNSIGSANSYQHSAHPTKVTATLKIRVSGTDKEYYPVSFSWSNSSLDYYHPQDGTTYYPSFIKSLSTFTFVHTEER